MKLSSVAVATVVAVASSATMAAADKNGGSACAACSILINVVEQGAAANADSAADWLAKKGCNLLPSSLRPSCAALISKYGPAIVKAIDSGLSPDEVCYAIKVCTSKTCILFPPSKQYDESLLLGDDELFLRTEREVSELLPEGDYSHLFTDLEWSPFNIKVNDFTNTHLPQFDFDKDGHPNGIRAFRGSAWRGKDCNESNKQIYPGRIVANNDTNVDSDCNGIFGVNPETNVAYETELCEGTDARGVLLIGDSAGAHFHLPPQWLEGATYNAKTFNGVVDVVGNEIDFPHQSWSTGFVDKGEDLCPGPVDSIYKRFRDLNRCNHRDYQNNGVNGSRMTDANKTLVPITLTRDRKNDKPVQVFLSMFGNDVCNSKASRMTDPIKFKEQTEATLAQLNDRLPNGSNVLMTGLADGRLLYDTLHDKIHPVGRNVTYSNVYSFLNCLEVSPCAGWMNDNQTIRDETYVRMTQLNNILQEVTDTAKATKKYNFGLDYFFVDFKKAAEDAGLPLEELVEPVDGFHPNQNGMAAISQLIWEFLTTKTNFIPPANPNNDKINALFRNQGGY